MRPFARRFALALGLLPLLTAVGAIGYVVIEDASLLDAIFMSAITLTAVGYDEVFPLSEAGRTFTMLLLLGGLTWMGLWFALITSFIVELDLRGPFRKRRIMKQIASLSGHVVICGAGRSGRQIAEEFRALGEDFALIESDADRVSEIQEMHPDTIVLQGNATTDHVLRQAGAERARGLISCVSSDTDNLFVCLSARDLNRDLVIVTRAQAEESIEKMYRAGANHVVSPMVTGAIQMATAVLRPSILSFLDITTGSGGMALRFEEATVGSGARVEGRTLEDARIPSETGLLVIAVKKRSEDGEDAFVFNPAPDTRLESGDRVIVVGPREQVNRLRRYVSG